MGKCHPALLHNKTIKCYNGQIKRRKVKGNKHLSSYANSFDEVSSAKKNDNNSLQIVQSSCRNDMQILRK